MRRYKADLHIHTVLSPCGDLDMAPARIVGRAVECGLDIIGITDHNSTLQCEEVRRIGEREGIFVLCGAEITTSEEVHCLAFVEHGARLEELQRYLSDNLPDIRNDPELFGHQVVVDERERILYKEERVLISALRRSLLQVEEFVHGLGGMVIPAHVDKKVNGILSQLGFVPPGLRADAMEISPWNDRDGFLSANPAFGAFPLVSFSDAHYLHELSRRHTVFTMRSPCLEEMLAALRGEGGRGTEIVY